MSAGIRSTDLTQATAVDFVLGNRLGSTVVVPITRLAAILTALLGPTYTSRSALFADLGWPAGTQGYVRGDANPALDGVYTKSGDIDAGSWTRTADLPSGAIEESRLAAVESTILLLATMASPALTGIPTAPTAAPGTNTTQLATTAFIQQEIGALIAGSPGALDTLNELAAALGDDANFAATMATALAGKAPLNSPALTGTPTAPTAAPGTNTTQLSTTAFVQQEIGALIAGSPGALDTLNELAAALGDDANFAATMATALALKAPLNSPALTGAPTAPTAAPGTNTTQLSTTAFVAAAIALLAPLASPALTGTPTAPDAAPGTNSGQIANTKFVQAAVTAAVAALLDSAPGALDTLNELAAALGDDANFAATMATALAGKAPLNSPALTGTPTVPTAVPGTSTTQAASTAFVQAAIGVLLDTAPGALNTLAELAAALGNDANFATTITNALTLKAPLASPALTGTPTAPTAAPGTNTTQIATAAFVQQAITTLVGAAPGQLDTLAEIAAALGNDANLAATLTAALAAKAPLASPVLTGTPTAPTAAVGTDTAQIATAALVVSSLLDWLDLSETRAAWGAPPGALAWSPGRSILPGATIGGTGTGDRVALFSFTADGYALHVHEGEYVVPAGDLLWPPHVTEVTADHRALARQIGARQVPYLGLVPECDTAIAAFVFGQSVTGSTNSGLERGRYDQAPHPAALCFPFGTMGLGNTPMGTLDTSRLIPLRSGSGPAGAGQGQSMAEGLSMQVLAELAEAGELIPSIAVLNCSWGSASAGNLSYTANPAGDNKWAFANLITGAQRLSSVRPSARWRPVLIIDQGETSVETGQDPAVYRSLWEQILDDFDAHVVQAAFGLPPGDYVVLVTPMPVTVTDATNGGGGQGQQTAWEEIAAARGNVHIAAQRYDLSYMDAYHPDGDSNLIWGARLSHALAEWYRTGTVTRPAKLASAAVVGSTILVTATEPLIDMAPGWSATHRGFVVQRGGVPQAIASTALRPDGTIVLTMSGTPAAGDVVRYARVADRSGIGPGARGTLGSWRRRVIEAHSRDPMRFPLSPSDIIAT